MIPCGRNGHPHPCPISWPGGHGCARPEGHPPPHSCACGNRPGERP